MKFDKSKDFRVKPDKPHKSVLTPSSFYKGNCQRCTWMLYQHNFSVPANLALQLKMAAFQEATFDGVFSRVISQTLPEGFVRQHKGKFSSQPLDLNGKTSNW